MSAQQIATEKEEDADKDLNLAQRDSRGGGRYDKKGRLWSNYLIT